MTVAVRFLFSDCKNTPTASPFLLFRLSGLIPIVVIAIFCFSVALVVIA